MEWNDVHAMMLATRARAVRRRILELGASRPRIGPAELERYDGRILGRHNRAVSRMLELAERLERGDLMKLPQSAAIAIAADIGYELGREHEDYADIAEDWMDSMDESASNDMMKGADDAGA